VRVDPASFSLEIGARVKAANAACSAIHAAIAASRSPLAGVGEEVDGLLAAMHADAERAQRIHGFLAAESLPALERRVARESNAALRAAGARGDVRGDASQGVKRDGQGRYPAAPPGWSILVMYNSFHSHLIARHGQNQIAKPPREHTAPKAKLARPRLRAVAQWLGRKAPAEAPAPAKLSPLPPR
jgi:hypothetical protein